GDPGVAQLRGMTKLKKLSLQGAALSDEGIKVLAGMTDLEELNLYATKITNAAVEVLQELKKLRTVDLRYARMTRAGVDRLVAAVQKCDVTFLDPSPRPPVPADADRRLADDSDAAASEWVKAIGGKAIVEDGRLREISLSTTSVTDALLANL